jgi:glycosyltransferase involved in cell wall biosynthesis
MTIDTTDGGAVRMDTVAISVIVPAYNCPVMLRACLDGLLASDLPRKRWELIVVDDSSTDNTPDIARLVADRVLTTSHGPNGPGDARNLGAVAASAPVLLFVDADVVLSAGTLSGVLQVLDSHPTAAAVFGSYDDRPAHASFLSQYRNLLHHYVHSLSAGEISTFWAGCGAVRRSAFLDVGGFDTRRYPRPQIEDIELGYRLSDRGYRILLVPELQGRHLKHWTLWNMVRTDLRDRAVPWMRLLLERRDVVTHGPLNLQVKEKVLTVFAGMAVLCIAMAVMTWNGAWLLGAMACVLAVVMGNTELLRWFRLHRGLGFALGVVPFRVLFYLISGAGAAWAILSHMFQPVHSAVPPLPHYDPSVAPRLRYDDSRS